MSQQPASQEPASQPEEHFERVNPLWRSVFTGEVKKLQRGRAFFKFISPLADDRCRICLAPFEGIAAPIARWLGRGPWHRNPHYCDLCETMFRQQRGGAELDIATLFADVRGSTLLASSMRPTEFGALMQRFYLAATKVFRSTDAVVDKMVGDEVIGLYFPGLTGDDYRRTAARAAHDLLRATGHGEGKTPWLSIGIGVHCGPAFVGSLGRAGDSYEFAVLGDTMNVGARLTAAAGPGEILFSEAMTPYAGAAGETRTVELKGVAAPARVRVARLG
jgi:adenylate cyclase